MSGNSGIRGYLLQTIAGLLDAVMNSEWVKLTFEPQIGAEKVDIIWYYPNNAVKIVQVKSSQNQITTSLVKKWAKELRESYTATEYELVLIGHCATNVSKIKSIYDVVIPTPKTLDIPGLIEQAAHRLDIYIEKRNLPKLSALTREFLIKALITEFEMYSTQGTPISREHFYKLVDGWILNTVKQIQQSVSYLHPTQSSMTLNEWIKALITYQVVKNPSDLKSRLKLEIIEWVNQNESISKIVQKGIRRISQGGKINKNEIWAFYSEAKSAEELLESANVPIVVLEPHIAYRESVRHYRRAIGKLLEADQRAFSDEMSIAVSKAKESQNLLENIKMVMQNENI